MAPSPSKVWLHLIGVFILIGILLPFGWIGVTAFPLGSPTSEQPLVTLFQTTPVVRYLSNSLGVALGSSGLALILGTPAGFSLARLPPRIANGIALLLLGIRLIPPVVLLIPYYLLMRDWRLLDTYAGVILVQSVLQVGFVAWFMRGFFQMVPSDLEDAACLDGCTRWGSFGRIVLPLSLSPVLACGLVGILFSWNDFFTALVLSGVNTRGVTLGILAAVGSEQVDWGLLAAFSLVALAPMLLVIVLVMAGQQALTPLQPQQPIPDPSTHSIERDQ